MSRISLSALAALLATVAIAAPAAAQVHTATATDVATVAPASMSRPGLPPLSAAEINAVSRSMEGLVMVLLPNGAVGFDAQGRFQDFATASIAADGRIVFRCVEDADALRAILTAPQEPAAPALEER